MDYARDAIGMSASNLAQRPLEGIASATNRLNSSIVLLGQFIDRFAGAPQGETQAAAEPPPAGYKDSLNRLFEAVERLEQRVESIVSIG